jgi:hypothetical protein
MRWTITILVGAASVMALCAAMAQPDQSQSVTQQAGSVLLPPESITVTAIKPSEAAIKDFVHTRAAPTYVLGRMARWKLKICPLTIGLGDKYAKYINQRIRAIASAVGAPVNADPGCRPNVEVVFTTSPQSLMDSVRVRQPLFLGYHHNSREAGELAKVTRPIQAWYTTESLDMDGSRQIDTGTCGVNGGTTLNVESPNMADGAMQPGGGTPVQLSLPCAVVLHVTGFRARDGLSSGFFNILIVAEPAKLFDHEVGSLADYISMLALSQPVSLDNCREVPSVSNLLAPNCAFASSHITDGDLAYLHALYKLPDGELLATQRNYISRAMEQVLVTDKGGPNSAAH